MRCTIVRGVRRDPVAQRDATPRCRASPRPASSSFTPIGTPPNGSDTSARAAAASACVAVLEAERVQVAGLDRRRRSASSSSTGERSPAPERLDQRAGIALPRCVSHGRLMGAGLYRRRLRSASPWTHATFPRPRAEPQPVPLDAAGHRGHLHRSGASCSAAPASAPRSRRWRAPSGRQCVWATAQYLSYAEAGRGHRHRRDDRRRAATRSPRRARSATSATARSSPSTPRSATGPRGRRASGSRCPTCPAPEECAATRTHSRARRRHDQRPARPAHREGPRRSRTSTAASRATARRCCGPASPT